MNRLLALTIITVAAIAGAVTLRLAGVDGWGWMIAIALLALLGVA